MELDLSKIHPSWNEWLEKQNVTEIKQKLREIANFTPSGNRVFYALQMPVQAIKIAIIGQDPYTAEGMATGLAFGNTTRVLGDHQKKGTYSPSLRTILNATKCTDSTLYSWFGQGVFLINTILTATTNGEPKDPAHKFWVPIIESLIRFIAVAGGPAPLRSTPLEEAKPIVFIAWGNDAKILLNEQITRRGLPNPIFSWTHPSPRINNILADGLKFENCTNFNDANNVLVKYGWRPIKWNTRPLEYSWPPYLLFTDGGCSANGVIDATAKSGFALLRKSMVTSDEPGKSFVMKYELVHSESYTLTDKLRTNNRAELMGILRGLQHLQSIEQNINVTIITDSSYSINILNHAQSAHLNLDVVNPIFVMMSKMIVNFVHVEAHSKNGISKSSPPVLTDIENNYDQFMVWWNDFVDQLTR